MPAAEKGDEAALFVCQRYITGLDQPLDRSCADCMMLRPVHGISHVMKYRGKTQEVSLYAG